MVSWGKKDLELLRNSIEGYTLPSLRDLKIKITDGCNLRCPKCDYWEISPDAELSTEKLFSVLDEGREIGLEEVQLSGGEPLTRKDLERIISHGTNQGIFFSIVSNGAERRQEKYDLLAEAGLKQWSISLDHYNAKGYQDATNSGNLGFSKVIDNINHLVSLRDNKKINQVNVISVITKENYSNIIQIVDLVNKLGVNSIRLMPYDFRQASMHKKKAQIDKLNPTEEDIKEYNTVIVPQILEYEKNNNFAIYPSHNHFIFGEKDTEIDMGAKGETAIGFYDKHTCFMPWHHVTLFPNGKVYACCKKPGFELGNVHNQSLEEIFTGEKMLRVRNAFLDKKHFSRCGSCASKLYENTIIEREIHD